MMKINYVLSALASLTIFTACTQAQKETEANAVEQAETTVQVAEVAHKQPHPYGGWYCPDNVLGFPPVDIKELHNVPVVEGRLPTEEETRSGKALIYVDISKYPDANPLDITLPQLATIHSAHNDMDELIIVIQALVIGQDTIVGYRFANGGNGSANYGDVSFLSDDEIDRLGSNPFVFEKIAIMAKTEKIWQAFAATAYAQNLGERFDKQDFFHAAWNNHAMAKLEYTLPGERAIGSISNLFGNLYLHIDYSLGGTHYAEKVLIIEEPTTGISTLYLVAGPYQKNAATYRKDWQALLMEIKTNSEG